MEDFEQVYMRHYRSVYRYVLGLTRSTDEADEVTADTFARAFNAWPAKPPAAGTELGWLLLTARRRTTDRWRRARRLVGLHFLREPHTATEQNVEFWLWFDALSRTLPARQREVLLLRYQRDLSDADIGMVMGITPSGVRSLVSRALENLRAHPELLA